MHIRDSLLACSALLLTLACSCSGGPVDPAAATAAGYAELGKGQFGEAADDFKAALAGMPADAKNPQYLRARMGMIEALTHIDPVQAKEEFLGLAAMGVTTESDYLNVAGKLAAAKGGVLQAIAVVDHGLKGALAKSEALHKQVGQLKAQAEKEGDPEALKLLEGLGYL